MCDVAEGQQRPRPCGHELTNTRELLAFRPVWDLQLHLRMRHLGLFAFGLTTTVLVPTALHVLQAGPKQVAKLVAPDAGSLEINGAKIDVAVDKGIVDPGSKVKVTLTSSARAKVDVLVYESAGSGGGRVELPPVRVGYEEVSFGGAETKSIALSLPGNRGFEMDGRNPFGHYTIFVLPQGSADKLERLRHRAAKVEEPMADSSGRYQSWENAYYQLGSKEGDTPSDAENAIAKPGEVARLDVMTRPSDSPVSIVVQESAKVGDDIVVKVKVKNPSKKPIDKVDITLAAKGYALRGEYKGLDEEQVEITGDDGQHRARGPRDQGGRVPRQGDPRTARSVCSRARAARSDDCYSDPKTRLINDAALDAVDIAPAERARRRGARSDARGPRRRRHRRGRRSRARSFALVVGATSHAPATARSPRPRGRERSPEADRDPLHAGDGRAARCRCGASCSRCCRPTSTSRSRSRPRRTSTCWSATSRTDRASRSLSRRSSSITR